MQQDLFESIPRPSDESGEDRMAFLERHRISLRLDQALIAVMAILVLFVLVFSCGVENGKRMASSQPAEALTSRIAQPARTAPAEPAPVEVQSVAPVEKIETPTPVVIEVASEPASSSAQSAQAGLELRPPGKYTIQMVTYTSSSTADKTIRKLSKDGHVGFVIPSGKYHQVCVNTFETRAGARQALRSLKDKGIVPGDAYVRLIPVA